MNKAKILFFVFVLFLAIVFLGFIPRISIPLIFSYFIALAIQPLSPMLMKLGLSRMVSYVVITIGMIVAITLPTLHFAPKITTEIQKAQDYIPRVEVLFHEGAEKLRHKIKNKTGFEFSTNQIDEIIGLIRTGTKSVLLKAPNFFASLFEWFFVVPLFVFFFIKDSRGMKSVFLRLVPNPLFERSYHIMHQFNKKLGDYIFAKFIEASIVGFVITIGLVSMNVNFSLILGVIAGVTNIIPYVGPVIGMIPGIIFCYLEYGQGTILYAVILLYVIANVIDLAIVFPLLVSKVVDLHPIIVVISVIIGSQYLGIIGMVISIPLAAVFKLIFYEVYRALYPILSKQNY